MILLNKHKDGSPADAVYIGRGSPLGNPYVIGEHGTRPEVIEKYRVWLAKKIEEKDPEILKALDGLTSDSKLLCFCHPAPCHGSVIDELWTEHKGYTTVGDVYRKWLIKQFIIGDAKAMIAFREREYTQESLPEKFRHTGSSRVFIDLYNEINVWGTFEEGLAFVAQKYLGKKIYRPEADGVDHINIYSKARTRLGRMLSNFAPIGFIHPLLGHFRSVEAFWYYTSRESPPESLRELYGYEAKKLGKPLPKKEGLTPEKHAILVRQAIQCKIYQNDDLKHRLIACNLPLSHYYVFGSGPNAVIREDDRFNWMVDYILEVREKLINQNNQLKVIVAGSRYFGSQGSGGIRLLDMAYQDSGFKATEIVSGGAKGPDTIAITHISPKYGVPYVVKEAKWDELGKKAGILRNIEMGDYADALVALWDGKSSGTRHMIEYMLSLGKPVYVSEFPF